MGALANVRNNLKQSAIVKMMSDVRDLLVSMVVSEGEVDGQTVAQAINAVKKENPEINGLEKIEEAINFEESKLNNAWKERFEIEEKDEDGYNKIPDKLKDIKEKVSEKEALEKSKDRAKGGRQKTRVDED